RLQRPGAAGGTAGPAGGVTVAMHADPADEGADDLADEAYAAALAALSVAPRTLAALLAERPPRQAWLAATGAAGGPRLGRIGGTVADLWAAHRAAGVDVHLLARPGYPPRLAADHQAPTVLFSRGSLDALDWPCVTVVGTRRC